MVRAGDRIEFEQALAETSESRRHLLLGNGFSISVPPDFGYPRLHAFATAKQPDLISHFADGETNFERALARARTEFEASQIRTALIQAVAAVHPRDSLKLTDQQRRACGTFLEQFIGRTRTLPGSVFTTNYDLLLHWVISRSERSVGPKRRSRLKAHDGFEGNGIWHEASETQVFYLHGAVHIFERPYNERRLKFETRMLRYWMGHPLTHQIEQLLAFGETPVFVAEGSSAAKIHTQGNWNYLKHARKAFRTVCEQEDNALFTFGHSFGESDDHLTEQIAAGRIKNLYVGVYGRREVPRMLQLAERWVHIRAQKGLPPPNIRFYPTSACSVWK